METPLVAADKFKSLNVEESRAKRLGRQQARLRDRGGIFRPENRNTNLFDILCQATHRRSPAKGRARSRSRSVSPKKKVTTVQTSKKPRSSQVNARTSPRKSTTAAPDATAELPEEDIDPKPRAKKPKGKQKQAAEVVDVGDDGSKPKPRAKRAGSKKATTKAPRRAAKKASNDDPPDEDVDPATKTQKTRPKGKRKKQDAEDDEFLEDPPPKSKKTKTTRSKAPARLLTPEPAETKVSKKPAPKSGSQLEGSENKDSRPRSKGSSDRPTTALDPPPQSTGSKTTKRKAGDSDIEDESRPQKRTAVSKPHEDLEVNEALRNKHKPVSPGNNTTNESLVDAINRASNPQRRPMGVEANHEATEIKHVSKKSKHAEPPIENSEPAVVSRAKEQVRTQIEAKDEPQLVESKSKESVASSSNPTRAVLETTPVPVVHKIGPPKRKNAKKSKGIDDKGQEKLPTLKTVSRKQKENGTAAKPASSVPAERKKSSKDGPKIPAHVRRKLQEKQYDHVSDGEPDPIDFLS